MGLISLTWVFCHNLVKIHIVIIEILCFSCSVLFLVTADGDHLELPYCKRSKWLNAKIIVIESCYNSIERFFQFSYFAFLSKRCHLDRSILFDFETNQCKNHFDTNLVKIH